MTGRMFFCSITRLAIACAVMAMSATPAQAEGQVWGYKVKPGDRLVDIAKTYQKNPEEWKRIQERNAVTDPKQLQPGKVLNIPVQELRQGDPVAEAVLVHGDVQRVDKTGQSVSKLASGEVLKMGESVRTGERSTLTIRFTDGSRMLVTEKSNVTLASLINYGKTGMADTKVQVNGGGVDSQVSSQKGSASRYEVNTPAINLTVRGTDFRVQVDGATGGTRTEVVEGAVAGKSDDGQAMIGHGFGLIAEPGKPLGAPTKLLPAPQFLPSAEVLGRLPLAFSWQPLNGAQAYRLQLLAKVKGLDALVAEDSMANTQVQWDDLPDGDYVLRVRGIDGVGLEGVNASKSFTLKARPFPPTLSQPLDQTQLRNTKVFFRWNAAEVAHEYTFQLAEDAAFTHVVAQVPQIPAQTRGVLLSLPPGTYYWRVASVTQDGDAGPYSDAFTFRQQSNTPGAD